MCGARANTVAAAAARHSSNRTRNSTQAAAGPAFTAQPFPKMSDRSRISATACTASRSSASTAAPTWGTSSMTDQPPQASATASTRHRSSSTPSKPPDLLCGEIFRSATLRGSFHADSWRPALTVREKESRPSENVARMQQRGIRELVATAKKVPDAGVAFIRVTCCHSRIWKADIQAPGLPLLCKKMIQCSLGNVADVNTKVIGDFRRIASDELVAC